jgi:hypothetical protein
LEVIDSVGTVSRYYPFQGDLGTVSVDGNYPTWVNLARALSLEISKYLVYIAGGSKIAEWRLIGLLMHKSRRLPGQPERLPGRRSNHLLRHCPDDAVRSGGRAVKFSDGSQ